MKALNVLFIFLLFSFIKGSTSDEGILFLIEREGFNISQYTNDYTYINPSEFKFLNGRDIYLGIHIENLQQITLYEGKRALRYLVNNVYEKLIDKYDIVYHFNQNQYNALISFAFNKGNIDELTDYGTKTIEEISSSFLNYINDKEGNNVYENRRQKEKELFDKPVNRNVKYTLKIAHHKPLIGLYIFAADLTSEDYDITKIDYNYNYQPTKDIGVIYYDAQNGNIMKTECASFKEGSLQCYPYYPIQKGEYIIKLNNNGYFDNGLMVLPFDLTNEMYSKKQVLNQLTNQYEEEDKRIKINETYFQLPIFKEYYSTSGLYGNFFFHIGKISLYNKKEIIKDKYPVEFELIYFYLNNSSTKENTYQIDCKIIQKDDGGNYIDNIGEFFLKCMGIMNTNAYNIENYGDHIEIRYRIGKSNLQVLQKTLGYNRKKESPRDILEIKSFTYEYNPTEGNIFKFYGNSLNEKEIRNIGSNTNLYNFNIEFKGGYFVGNIHSKCFLYNDGLNQCVIQCYLKSLLNNDIILSSVEMKEIFINEQNNIYDIILPFEFALNIEVKKWDKEEYNEDEYCIYKRNNQEINSEICKTFHTLNERYICDFSEKEKTCIERPMKCTEKKTGATVSICHELSNYQNDKKVCIKEGDSCVETNSCSKVKFHSTNCENLMASSNDDICINSGEECREINAEKYNNRYNSYNSYNSDENENEIKQNEIRQNENIANKNPENKYEEEKDNGMILSLSFVIFSLFVIL